MAVRRLNVGDELAIVSVVTLSGEEVRPMTQAEVNLHNRDCDAHDKWEAEEKYKEDRKAEYPPYENYLDGIVKGDQDQVDKYISDCLAVKKRFPKGVH